MFSPAAVTPPALPRISKEAPRARDRLSSVRPCSRLSRPRNGNGFCGRPNRTPTTTFLLVSSWLRSRETVGALSCTASFRVRTRNKQGWGANLDFFLLFSAAHFRPYTYWPLVILACTITQHVSVIFVFLATFVRLNEHALDPRTLVWLCVACFLGCYGIWVFLEPTPSHLPAKAKLSTVGGHTDKPNSRTSTLRVHCGPNPLLKCRRFAST